MTGADDGKSATEGPCIRRVLSFEPKPGYRHWISAEADYHKKRAVSVTKGSTGPGRRVPADVS